MIKEGLYIFLSGNTPEEEDKLIVKKGSIEFPTEDDRHNLDMFPAGKISAYTEKKLRHYIDTGCLKLVK